MGDDRRQVSQKVAQVFVAGGVGLEDPEIALELVAYLGPILAKLPEVNDQAVAVFLGALIGQPGLQAMLAVGVLLQRANDRCGVIGVAWALVAQQARKHRRRQLRAHGKLGLGDFFSQEDRIY